MQSWTSTRKGEKMRKENAAIRVWRRHGDFATTIGWLSTRPFTHFYTRSARQHTLKIARVAMREALSHVHAQQLRSLKAAILIYKWKFLVSGLSEDASMNK